MIFRFFQRYAGRLAVLAGSIGYRLLLPDNSPWWQELGTGLAITVAIYLLLYRYGVTRNGGNPK